MHSILHDHSPCHKACVFTSNVVPAVDYCVSNSPYHSDYDSTDLVHQRALDKHQNQSHRAADSRWRVDDIRRVADSWLNSDGIRASDGILASDDMVVRYVGTLNMAVLAGMVAELAMVKCIVALVVHSRAVDSAYIPVWPVLALVASEAVHRAMTLFSIGDCIQSTEPG